MGYALSKDKAAKTGKLPSFIYGVTNVEEEIYFKASGNLDFHDKSSPPLTPDSILWICSMTKLATAVSATSVVAHSSHMDDSHTDCYPPTRRARTAFLRHPRLPNHSRIRHSCHPRPRIQESQCEIDVQICQDSNYYLSPHEPHQRSLLRPPNAEPTLCVGGGVYPPTRQGGPTPGVHQNRQGERLPGYSIHRGGRITPVYTERLSWYTVEV